MNFAQALQALLAGRVMARAGWSNGDAHVWFERERGRHVLVPDTNPRGNFRICFPSGTSPEEFTAPQVLFWHPRADDLLRSDWGIVDLPHPSTEPTLADVLMQWQEANPATQYGAN